MLILVKPPNPRSFNPAETRRSVCTAGLATICCTRLKGIPAASISQYYIKARYVVPYYCERRLLEYNRPEPLRHKRKRSAAYGIEQELRKQGCEFGAHEGTQRLHRRRACAGSGNVHVRKRICVARQLHVG
eukprot:gnl/Chilomastix_cuspidata/3449.p3 GENE.gnl/Chilomastix_cuspidata/3449~~gnl/Chilomastix_cuspidata/3449.p3  ORF type:complete len:131 (+),score=2.28 gnl/Chilomastix_cuspidata/3449:498-890(+)